MTAAVVALAVALVLLVLTPVAVAALRGHRPALAPVRSIASGRRPTPR